MAGPDGSWDCTAKTPLGQQSFTLTIRTAGDRFTGGVSGELGSKEIADGQVNGNNLEWKMQVSSPMRLNLDCEATIDEDRIEGVVRAGFLGVFPLSGVRAG
jgi:hypothetical protein